MVEQSLNSVITRMNSKLTILLFSFTNFVLYHRVENSTMIRPKKNNYYEIQKESSTVDADCSFVSLFSNLVILYYKKVLFGTIPTLWGTCKVLAVFCFRRYLLPRVSYACCIIH